MHFDRKSYGARIRQLRIRKGFTQKQLAEKLNVSGTYIVKREKCRWFLPSRRSLQRQLLFDIFVRIEYTANEAKLGSPERRRAP